MEEQKHGNGCRCDNCERKKISGIKVSAAIFEEGGEEKNREERARQFTPKEFSDLQRAYRIEEVKKWERERREHQHLEHPFYKDANVYREDIRKEQILKGAHKYPEPFNPNSWTAKELLQHAMQENVDQAHYIFGLFEKVEEMQNNHNAEYQRLLGEKLEVQKQRDKLRFENEALTAENKRLKECCQKAEERFETLESNYGIYREDL